MQQKLNPPRKLLQRVSDKIRLKHYAYSTEKVYLYWIRQYILFHKKRHPEEMGAKEIEEYLTWLAKVRKISSPTEFRQQNKA